MASSLSHLEGSDTRLCLSIWSSVSFLGAHMFFLPSTAHLSYIDSTEPQICLNVITYLISRTCLCPCLIMTIRMDGVSTQSAVVTTEVVGPHFIIQTCHIQGDRKVTHPLPDTFYICQRRRYIEISKQKTVLY
jgi:hypothetical protein